MHIQSKLNLEVPTECKYFPDCTLHFRHSAVVQQTPSTTDNLPIFSQNKLVQYFPAHLSIGIHMHVPLSASIAK